MSEENTTKTGIAGWLQKKGLSPNEKPQSPKPTGDRSTESNSRSERTDKPVAKKWQRAGKTKTIKPNPNQSKNEGGKSQNRPAGKPGNNDRKQQNRSNGKPRPSGRRTPGHQVHKSDNDPFLHRPTFEKRERYHPTNFLKGSEAGDIKIVPLGGMEQVGENMMFLEWDDDIIVIDTGITFGGPSEPGVDLILPDISYLKKNKHRIKAIVYTHGHLDHIGGAHYMLPELGWPPLYATPLTQELMYSQAEEFPGHKDKLRFTSITPKSRIKLGKFELEFFHINHSIPDGLGIVVKTPYGSIVHTSDFKFDHRPSDDQPADLARMAEIGREGVAVLMSDSTSTMKAGHSMSEAVIEEQLDKIIKKATGRIVLATFASNIGRVSKIIESAERYGRTVYIAGRSMERNLAIARKLNYLKCKDKTIRRMDRSVEKNDPSKVLVLCTGTQGEELAALSRMSRGEHAHVKLTAEDSVVFSSSPIPGNEMAIVTTLNNLAEKGIKYIDHKQMDTHVSGHASAEDCKLMFALMNPKNFAPIHGEVFMRHYHRDMMIRDFNFNPKNNFIMKNGEGLIVNSKGVRLMPPGTAFCHGDVFVQDKRYVSADTIEERQSMSDNGIIVFDINAKGGTIKSIDVRTRGFLIDFDPKHKFWQKILKSIELYWSQTYDPSRPANALTGGLAKRIQLEMKKDFWTYPLIEILVRD